MPASESPAGELTELLRAWGNGDPAAEQEVWTIVYDELRKLARQVRYGHGKNAHAGTTTMVHEAYLRLLGTAKVDWNERGHFFAVAARAMRFMLVDQARRRLAQKRDAELADEELDEITAPTTHPPEDILGVHRALEQLAEVNPRHQKLVELHFFSGLSLKDSAEILGISRRTAVRDWKAVRTWLHGELKSTGPESTPRPSNRAG